MVKKLKRMWILQRIIFWLSLVIFLKKRGIDKTKIQNILFELQYAIHGVLYYLLPGAVIWFTFI